MASEDTAQVVKSVEVMAERIKNLTTALEARKLLVSRVIHALSKHNPDKDFDTLTYAELGNDVHGLCTRNKRMQKLLELPLLFYASGEPNHERWEAIVGEGEEMTTKVMCDAIRVMLDGNPSEEC